MAALPTTHEFHVPLGSDERAVASELQRQAETVAGSTDIEPLPAGVLGDQAVTEAMATPLADVTARTRKRIERRPAPTPSPRIS